VESRGERASSVREAATSLSRSLDGNDARKRVECEYIDRVCECETREREGKKERKKGKPKTTNGKKEGGIRVGTSKDGETLFE
jgi:hypothetical protein